MRNNDFKIGTFPMADYQRDGGVLLRRALAFLHLKFHRLPRSRF